MLSHWWAAMSLPNEWLVEATYRLREGLAAGIQLTYLPCCYCGAAHVDKQLDPHRTHRCHKCLHMFCTAHPVVGNPLVLLSPVLSRGCLCWGGLETGLLVTCAL